ncbi:MAG: PAS domain-containing sensor histidine kinase [Holosporaceae bacterium]|jgi:signal transduction histidine kinase|nr:PAS domain-containing sensor histidine kinase [Holosporaceae bacterium]
MKSNNAALLDDIYDSDTIESTVAMFRNFSPEKPISNAVVYFWESHTKNDGVKKKIQSTIDLIYKEFDIPTCEKYEIHTGYLSRYNYLPRPLDNCVLNEINQAVLRGKEEQNEWLSLYAPELPEFKKVDWQDCISREKNLHYDNCKDLVIEKKASNIDFATAFLKSVVDYAEKHNTDKINGELYILEEISWILSLPLLHINKPIYLIHVGSDNPAIKALFHNFPNLQKAVKWLSPHFCNSIFLNTSDFLMDYRNAAHMGHSYAMENKDLSNSVKLFKKEEIKSKVETAPKPRQTSSVDEILLHTVIEKFPGHVYWLNCENVYLGCNSLQAKSFGLKSCDEVVGKTNFDLLPFKDATELNKINKIVMEGKQPYDGEEHAEMRCKSGYYITQKIPLLDNSGKAVGLLGISIDITDRKKAANLEVKNKLQEMKIEKQEEFKKFTARVVHDITSPLISLEHFAKHCKGLPEDYYATLMSIVTSIRNIAGDLLNRYMQDRDEMYAEQEQYILVPIALFELINQKRYQHEGLKIKLNYLPDPVAKFPFIKGNLSDFGRMISNLINNSIEAFDGENGVLTIMTELEDENIKIIIKDNGRGMSREFVSKINSGMPVGTTKNGGHAIGLGQVANTLELYNGRMLVESEEGTGTTVTINFPLVERPRWIANQIVLHKGGTVIIVYEERSIHNIWETLLKKYLEDLNLVFFENCKKAFEFIESLNDKSNLFLLLDLKFKNNNLHELSMVLQNHMKDHSLIITNVHSKMICEFVERAGMQILPKQYISEIPIKVE